MGVVGAGVVEAGVVLAEQVAAVVVAVGRADDRVDVVPRRGVVVEHDPALVVELDEEDRAVQAVVEDVVLAEAAPPGEPGVGQVPGDLLQAEGGVARAVVESTLTSDKSTSPRFAASAIRPSNRASKTPASRHCRKRLWTVDHAPNSAGISRH